MSQSWKRPVELQLDVKCLEHIAGTRRRFYQFTAIDDCTRIRVLKVFDACNQRTAIALIDDVLRRLPFRVHVVQTDNGAESRSLASRRACHPPRLHPAEDPHT